MAHFAPMNPEENKKQRSQPKNTKSGWDIINVLGTCTAGVAAILSVWISYTVNKQANETSEMNSYQAKVAAAFALHEKRLQEETLVESLQNVNSEILKIRTELSKVDSETQHVTLQGLNSKLSAQARKDIQFTLDFYRGVANCVDREICDEAATKSLFENEIKDFTVILAPSLCKLRDELNDETIARELEDFYHHTNPLCKEAKPTA